MPPLPIGRHTQGLGSRTHPRFQPFRHLHDCSDCPGWSGCRVGLAPTAKRLLSTAHPAFVVRQRAIFDRIGAKLMQRQRVLWCKPDFRSFDVETIPPRGGQPTAQDAQGVQGRGSVDQATKNADERPMARVNCGCIGSRWMVLGSRHQSGMALCGATVSSII